MIGILSAAALNPLLVVALVLCAAAIVVFFIIFLCIDRRKEGTSTRPAPQKTPERNSTDDYRIREINLEQNNRHKHWGNLTLAERIATLSPGDKVLYAAVKKQLNRQGLDNFASDICEVYFVRDQLAARLLIHRSQILLFLNINPRTLERAVYAHEDVSDSEGFEMLPTMITIKESAQTELISSLVDRLL